MLGSGAALATRRYNTCFVVDAGSDPLLVDAGGGNGILSQLDKAQARLTDIHHMFITHIHTDHILGAVWVTRMAIQLMHDGRYNGTFTVLSHAKALRALDTICRATLPQIDIDHFGRDVIFREVTDGETVTIGSADYTFFDIGSPKETQFGFSVSLPGGGGRLVCLGDEPFREPARRYAQHADWLMCEAYCLYQDRDRFEPYKKHHSTALDAGATAASLNVRRLILYHTEDRTPAPLRQAAYAAEARRHFQGPVIVPDDLDTITLALGQNQRTE